MIKQDSFAEKAASWDNPAKIEMANKFVKELLIHVQPSEVWKALEIGAGTGLVGLQFSQMVGELLLLDTSEAMLEIVKQKLTGLNNVQVLCKEIYEYTSSDLDFVFSCMAFHHLLDTEAVVKHLSTIVKPGGHVVVGDLVTEDGSFHGNETVLYNGFDMLLLQKLFLSCGFKILKFHVYNVLSRQIEDVQKDYEQFILVAVKEM